ncbi:MAG TPA: YceI family protein [Pyrinomonadaceae bacterium]|jgi:polyisoprenoid-binding protein YceI
MIRLLCTFVFAASIAAFAGLYNGSQFSGASASAGPREAPILSFRIDPSTSTFMVRAHRGGLVWFKGNDHYIAVRDFGGEASLTLDALNPASLSMTIQANSLEETGAKFTAPQKATIKKELNEIVLESAKYPTITFRSTGVTGGVKNGGFDIKIAGDITLHGVTKHITIPATVTVNGDTLNAKGKFELKRSDFGVKATTAFHGLVRVKDGLTFTFDINARRANS